MTQKSYARRMRDATKERVETDVKNGNKCWTEVTELYQSCAGLLNKHNVLLQQFNDKVLIAEVPDKSMLAANIRLIAKDIAAMNGELLEIYSQHKDKTGGSTDPDEVMDSIRIAEQYHLFMERHDAIIMPTAYQIIEQFNIAEQILVRKAQEQADRDNLTNPKITSDVEFKDVPPSEQ